MEEVLIELKPTEDNNILPSVAQLNAMVEYIQKNKTMLNTQPRHGMNKQMKVLWEGLAFTLNSLTGPSYTMHQWLRYWYDRKLMVCNTKKQSNVNMSPLDEQIWMLCSQNGNGTTPRKKIPVKREQSDNEYDSSDNLPIKKQSHRPLDFEQPIADVEGRHIAVMEKLVEVMDKQASALSMLGNASLSSSRAMERLAEASQIQANAVERLATSFEGIGSGVNDIRNAIVNIDYTMKRCYSINPT